MSRLMSVLMIALTGCSEGCTVALNHQASETLSIPLVGLSAECTGAGAIELDEAELVFNNPEDPPPPDGGFGSMLFRAARGLRGCFQRYSQGMRLGCDPLV